MSATLLCVILLTWVVGIRLYGAFTFVVAGILCFTIYSIPALFGLVFPFTDAGAGLQLASSSRTAVNATILAWLFFLSTIAIPGSYRRAAWGSPAISARFVDRDLTPIVHAALWLCIGGFTVIAIIDGPLFFLEERDAQPDSLVRLLWRWVNAAGLVAAVLSRSWRAVVVFSTALIIYFLSGDRTVLVITFFCLVVVCGHGYPVRVMFRWPVLLGLLAFLVVAMFGKPIYLAVKSGSIDFLQMAFTAEWISVFLTTFEPFITFNILDLVVRHDFQVSFWCVLEGVLGQLLILPSAFGIDSNSFNTAFTNEFAPRLTYGIAGNYWAQAWAIAGPLGVGLYAMIYGVILRACDGGARRYAGTVRVLLSLLGALIAVYAHRNSLDNLMSFVRQIFIVVLAISGLAHVAKPFFVSDAMKSAA